MDRLIVFTRYPVAGKVKTRLVPALGEERAALLHARMAEYTVNRLRPLHKSGLVDLEIRYDGGTPEQMRQWLGADLGYSAQGGGDLGERMARAFRNALDCGAGAAVIVGTDCPGITRDIVEEAFRQVRRTDVVLGPAEDGGYYLVGLRQSVPELFSRMPWGTGEVFEKSLAVAQILQLSVGLVDRLPDVDRPEDLPIWERVSVSERISVVIPTLNEAPNIERAVESAEMGKDVEVVVVDAGSADGTPEAARAMGAGVISSSPGRAAQQNLGAARATGGILLFLHGDCELPPGFDGAIRRALADPETAGGAFHLNIDVQSRAVRVIEWLGNWRSRRWGLPYGDQGIFVRAEVFRELGGFPDMEIMEDFAFVRNLRRRGRITILPGEVTAHGRRWRSMGALKTTLINQAVILGYHLGVPSSTLARWYGRERGVS